MLNRSEQHHHSPRDVPPVGRPRGAAWRSLQADGVVWEGQVLLVGGEVDLAARMIVTHRRVAFVRGGDVVLEVPRGWLRQEPVLRRDGILELFVTTPESDPFDEPMRVPLRMREGHPAAGHIIAMLAPGGVRRITPPDAMSAFERARGAAPTPSFGGFWEGVEPSASARRAEPVAPAETGFDDGDDAAIQRVSGALAPMEPPDRLVRLPSTPPRRPAVSGFTIAGMPPRGQRRSPWGLILRLAALTVLLAAAAALGAGRLNIRFPGTETGAVLTAPTATAPAAATNTDTANSSSGAAPTLSPEDLTAAAVGVGSDSGQPDTAAALPDNAPAQAEDQSSSQSAPPAAPTKPAIPTPATSPAVTQPTPTAEAAVAQASTAAASPSTPPTVAQVAAPPPTQEVAIGELRLSVPTALRGESLPKYGLPPGSGEWILLLAEITNKGNAVATVAMSDFRLLDRGTGSVADLDSGTGVIASLAGYKPARGAADSVSLNPGDSTQVLLLYLLPAGTGDNLSLQVGQTSLDLTSAFAAGSPTPTGGAALVAVNSVAPSVSATQARPGPALAFMPGGWRDRLRALER